MKKRINELLNGKFTDLQNTLELSEERICARTMENENFFGKFSILSPAEKSIQGFVQSTNPRVGLRPDSFSGLGETIRYEADVKGMEAGDVLKGEFLLNTSAGEYHLPYEITVESRQEERREVQVPFLTPEQFADLAKENFARAYVLFVSGAFRRMIREWGQNSQTLYDGLLAEGVSYRSLEQFLVGMGIKEAVSVEPENRHLILSGITETRKEELVIRKNTWGFAVLTISCDAEFLTLEKTQVTTEEFVGSVYHLGFMVNREKLHAGRQFARITISTGLEEMTCIVEVQNSAKRAAEGMLHRQKKEVEKVLSMYIRYRTGRMKQEAWAKETLQALDRYRRAEGKHIFYDLYESYVLFQIQDNIQAELLLGQIQERKEELKDGRWQACYLYLTTMQNKEEEYQEYVQKKIQELYLEQQESWILLWLMLRVNGQMYRNDTERLDEIRLKYLQGVHSPVLYLDACDILKKEPLMLRRLEGFEIHLLAFLCRNQVFDREISGQAAQLAQRLSGFDRILFRVLTECYRKTPTKNLLSVICKMLMDGRKKEKKYAVWFARGVMQDVRITGLYEAFIETSDHLDANELPMAIRLYFVYHNTLDSARKAAIYAAVIRNRERDDQTYASYRKGMGLFMEEQLAEGKISHDLVELYKDLLTDAVMTPHLAAGLEKVLFTYEVTCRMPGIRHLIVIHRAFGQEQKVVVTDGKALVQIMTPDYVLLAEDREGRRYAADPYCTRTRLMEQPQMEALCRRHLEQPHRILLHDCMTGAKAVQIQEEKIEQYLMLLKVPELKESYREELKEQLLEYFSQHPSHEAAERFLKQADLTVMAQHQMTAVARLLSGQDRYRELYQLICIYGMEKVELQILVRMCSSLLAEDEMEQDRMFLAVCVYCFKKKLYDEKMLAYLMKHYEGSLELMKEIWRAGQTFKLESFELEEKTLVLLLFLQQGSEHTEEIFASYEKKMGKSRICRAYVTWMSYESFVRDKYVEWSVFAYMEKHMLGIVGTPDICKLALLKRYTERKEKSAGQQKWMIYLLEKYLEQGMHFAFMQKLPGRLKERYHLYDKYILEYHGKLEKEMVLHYRYGEQEEKTVSMPEIFEGIYVKEFTLFYKDRLDWYVTENGKEIKEPKWQSYSHTAPASRHGGTRYDLVNQMIEAQEQGDLTQLENLHRRYAGQKYLVESVFGLN